MAAALEHLKVTKLTEEEVAAALECQKQLHTLRFRQQDGYEVCDDNSGLESASRMFIDKFAPWSKFGGKASKLKAFRFNEPATLPAVDSMLLVPTTTTGNPTISGHALQFGTYVQLTQDVIIQPGVICLVFKAQ